MDYTQFEERIEHLIDIIGSIATFDFSRQAEVDEQTDDPLNGVAVGLNILAEELEAKTTALDLLTQEQQKAIETINQMSTPIARLWDGILLLPLVGMMNSERIKNILSTILESISQTQARVFILDISGVGLIDTYAANHFVRIAKATRLMGCKSILSGISPAAAQTIVELGVNIDEIDTTSTMKDAMERAFAQMGFELSKSGG